MIKQGHSLAVTYWLSRAWLLLLALFLLGSLSFSSLFQLTLVTTTWPAYSDACSVLMCNYSVHSCIESFPPKCLSVCIKNQPRSLLKANTNIIFHYLHIPIPLLLCVPLPFLSLFYPLPPSLITHTKKKSVWQETWNSALPTRPPVGSVEVVPGLESGATGRVASAAGGANGMVGVDGARRTTTRCWYSQFADGLPCKESHLT